MPGILEGLRLDAGRSAGRTSSPDFFLSIGGFLESLPLLSVDSSSDSESDESLLRRLRSPMNNDESVFDRVWDIFREVGDRRDWTFSVTSCSSFLFVGSWRVNAGAMDLTSSSTRSFGEVSRARPILRIAACSSTSFSIWRPLAFSESSSSPEFAGDSGGDSTTPFGICDLSVTGGGDFLRLALLWRAETSSSASAVPGGVCSAPFSPNAVVLTDGVLRWRVRYEVDLGISGLDEVGEVTIG